MSEELFPRDKVCIAGIGESEYTRWGKATKSEFQLTLEAVLNACNDAGLDPAELDGFCSFSDDRNTPIRLASALGCKQLRYGAMVWGGGGGGCSASVLNAFTAVATGTANHVVAFRGLAQGQFGRFGQYPAGYGGKLSAEWAFSMPWGLLVPAQRYAHRTRRHMYRYGTTSRQMGMVAIASNKHAQRNPRAVMYGHPITIEDHQNSRMIADPFRLYDCCLENDGAAAAILTTAERARNLRQQPVYVMAAAMGTSFRGGGTYTSSDADLSTVLMEKTANDLYRRAGITQADVDVAQLYENFTGLVLQTLEDFGFCKRGESGPFAETGALEWPDGKLPINTSGGNLAEAYIHGFELVNEAVRQMRGTSTCQVPDAEICLVSSGPGTSPSSSLIVRR